MTIEVQDLRPDLESEYEDFLRRSPAALISYSLRYRDFLAELLGAEPQYAVALREGKLVGLLPLLALDGRYGRVLNSLPYFGSNGGPLTAEPEAERALLTWYAATAGDRAVAASTVIENPLSAGLSEPVHDFSDLRIGHVTSLVDEHGPREDVLSSLEGSTRRNVNKALRVGVTVTTENDALGVLHSLHTRSMSAIGAQVKSPEFFAAIPRHFRPGEDFDLYVARLAGEAVAALLVFYCGRSVDYYVPATSPEHRQMQPLAAILHQAMTDAAHRGFERWNWGGSWPSHESLQRFKAKWGGVRNEYRYWTKVNDPSLLAAAPETLLHAYSGFFVIPFSALAVGS
jgi:hypothetical protein